MRLSFQAQMSFASPLGPIEVRRKLGEVTRQADVVEASLEGGARPRYDGRLDESSFHLIDRRSPSYYGWVVLAGSVEQLPPSVGGVSITIRAGMHGRTVNFRLGFWSAWLFLLITIISAAETMPIAGWLWMGLFAAVLFGMHYLDYRSCLRETEYVRRLLQGSEPS